PAQVKEQPLKFKAQMNRHFGLWTLDRGLYKPAMPSPQSALATPLVGCSGVGPERAGHLARLGLHTVGDLLLHRPRRYEERRHFRTIAELEAGEPVTTRGHIVALGLKRFRRGTKSVFEFILED